MTGYLLIDKPEEITSFDCVATIKKILRQSGIKKMEGGVRLRVGHAGTLDPFATGLLIICIGREATREIDKLLTLDKTYKVTAKLGELTDTLDLTGKVIETCSFEQITKDDLENAIASLGEEYVQTPPIYSALKHEGQPLHKLAREGKISPEELEKITQKKSRKVTLFKLALQSFNPPFFTFTAHVSKGTYIRSLANDIAQKLDCCATTYELERTAIGPIPLAKATPLATIKHIEDITKHLLSKEDMSGLLS